MKDLTPKHLRCGDASPMCPAMFKSGEGTYIIIGKRLYAGENNPELVGRIGDDEVAVEIAVELVEAVVWHDT
jgi:hypothetical protein